MYIVLCLYRVIQTRVEVWENEKCHSIDTQSTLDRNTEYMFSISFRKHRNEKKTDNLLTLIIKM